MWRCSFSGAPRLRDNFKPLIHFPAAKQGSILEYQTKIKALIWMSWIPESFWMDIFQKEETLQPGSRNWRFQTPSLKALSSNYSPGRTVLGFLGVVIGVFWKNKSRPYLVSPILPLYLPTLTPRPFFLFHRISPANLLWYAPRFVLSHIYSIWSHICILVHGSKFQGKSDLVGGPVRAFQRRFCILRLIKIYSWTGSYVLFSFYALLAGLFASLSVKAEDLPSRLHVPRAD